MPRLPRRAAHASLRAVDIEFIASLVRQAFALAFYSAGIGGALGVLFVMVLWCALRPGTSTVIGTGLVALAVLGAGAHGAVHGGHSFAGGVVFFWGAVFVALSLRGAKTLEPAFFTALREAHARARLPVLVAALHSHSESSAGPYRRPGQLVDAMRRETSSPLGGRRQRPDVLWSRALVALYASAVTGVLAGVHFAT